MFKCRRSAKWTDGSCRCSFCGKGEREIRKLVAGRAWSKFIGSSM